MRNANSKGRNNVIAATLTLNGCETGQFRWQKTRYVHEIPVSLLGSCGQKWIILSFPINIPWWLSEWLRKRRTMKHWSPYQHHQQNACVFLVRCFCNLITYRLQIVANFWEAWKSWNMRMKKLLRKLRTNGFETFCRLFEEFHHWPWSTEVRCSDGDIPWTILGFSRYPLLNNLGGCEHADPCDLFQDGYDWW